MSALSQFELNILDLIATLHNPILDILMPLVTLLGDHGVPSILLALILLIIKKTRKEGVSLGFALISTLISCNLVLKPLGGRIRPYDLVEGLDILIPTLSDFSFPSGHTTVAFATAMVLSHYHKSLSWIFWILATLIGFSRLYLYVHFPTDVLFGVMLGIVCGLVGIKLCNSIYPRLDANSKTAN